MKRGVRVSDHAVLRYLERVLEIDVDLVRNHIAGLADDAARCGAYSVRHDGLELRIRNGCVMTVVQTGSPDTHSGGTRHRNGGSK